MSPPSQQPVSDKNRDDGDVKEHGSPYVVFFGVCQDPGKRQNRSGKRGRDCVKTCVMLLLLVPLERPLSLIADFRRYRGLGALGVNILEIT